jgi:hypothetical protein
LCTNRANPSPSARERDLRVKRMLAGPFGPEFNKKI